MASVCVCVCMCVYIMYVCVCVCMCVYIMYVCVYTCMTCIMHVCTHIHATNLISIAQCVVYNKDIKFPTCHMFPCLYHQAIISNNTQALWMCEHRALLNVRAIL